MKRLALALVLFAFPAQAEIRTMQLRSPAAYDGDTLYVVVPELPTPLQRMSVRVLGIDTAEIRGKCEAEKVQARAARDFVLRVFRGQTTVTLDVIGWDKYGGRFDAHVQMPDGEDLGQALIAAGLARPYDGGKRQGWCD